MNKSYDKEWWEASWKSRIQAVKSAFGPFEPEDHVRSFEMPDPKLTIPGGCAVTFRPSGDGIQLRMSLGLSQPLMPGTRASSWEFGIYAPSNAAWPNELLYDLVLGYAEHPGWLEEGHCLPLTFFRNRHGELDCGSFSADADPRITPVGFLRSMYLWRDLRNSKVVETSSGPFFLVCATGITADEEQAGDATSPPHVLLLLREMGIGQVTDPNRQSAFAMHGAEAAWNRIATLTHDQAISELMASEPS